MKLTDGNASQITKISPLLRPLKMGALELPNRIVMSPMTRCRSTPESRAPNAMVAEYYRQRASAGMIITESVAVSPMGIPNRNKPGIWSPEQIAGWRLVTETVHAAGGRIFMQLFHVGRAVNTEVLNEYFHGKPPVSSSERRQAGYVRGLRPQQPFSKPRALETEEIPELIEEFRQGAENAKLADFDGVEIHAGNGFLIDQFLQDSCNCERTDQYGGSIENRARFLLETVDAVAGVWGPDRVGVHLSPRGDQNDMGDSNPRSLFLHVATELGRRKLAFLFVREWTGPDSLLGEIKRAFNGPVIGNENHILTDQASQTMALTSAERLVETGTVDGFAFGREYISTPDLVERIALGAPFNPLAPVAVHYAFGHEGYIDFPTLAQLNANQTNGNSDGKVPLNGNIQIQ